MRPIDSYLVALLQKELRPEYGIVCNNFTLLQEDISTEVHLVMGNEEFSIIYSNEGDVHGNIRYAVKQFLINQKPYEYAMNEVKLRGLNETNLIELYFILKSIYEPRTIPGV